MQIGRLAARVVIGGLFVGHGTQRLFGWFGGPGLEGTDRGAHAGHREVGRAVEDEWAGNPVTSEA